ncbi:MAG: hypothetical protein Kow00114_30120 [Kiloniellaceae bacterium]
MADSKEYPGAEASAAEVLGLATEYHTAAQALLKTVRKGKPLSRAPCRLCAIHAIELYLNAFLLHLGETPEKIRAHRHDLATRVAAAPDGKLTFRKKTAEHLARMSEDREYLVTRYGPELAATLSEVNRLMATLEEVGTKVRAILLDQTVAKETV